MEEKGKRKKQRNCLPLTVLPTCSEVNLIDSKFLQTEAYIDAQCKGSYKKKKQNRKAIKGVEWKKTKSKSKQGVA